MDLTPRSVDDEVVASVGRKKKRNVVPMVVLGFVLVAGGVVVTQFLTSAVDYFCNVDEVGVRDGCDEERRIRLQGTVDAGTVDQSVPGTTSFTMTYNDATIAVRYDGDPGGIFEECVPVVVHGEIRDDVMSADRLEVKHSDEYEAESDANIATAEEYAATECDPVEV